MAEDLLDHRRIGQEGQHGEGRSGSLRRTAGTAERVDLEHPQEQPGPGHAPASGPGSAGCGLGGPGQGRGVGGRAWNGCGCRSAGHESGQTLGWLPLRWPGQERACGAAVGEDPEVPRLVGVGGGQQSGQTAEELQRLEHEMGRSPLLGPGTAELLDDPPVGAERQPVLGEGGTEPIAAEPFQPLTIGRRHRLRRMERESRDLGTERLARSGSGGLILLRARQRRRGSGGHGRVDRDEERLVEREQVGVEDRLASIAPARGREEIRQAPGQLERQLLHLAGCGRRQTGEPQPAVRGRDEEAIGQDAVDVGVHVESAAHALEEDDRPGLALGQPELARAPPLPTEEDGQGAAEHPREEGPVHRQAEAHGPGKGQDPLAVVGLGKEMIDQPGRRVGGATAGAARAEPGQLLELLAEALSEGCTLWISSRETNPIPLSRLAMQQQLARIEAAVLSFADDESAALLQRALAAPDGDAPGRGDGRRNRPRAAVPPEALARFIHRNEGWPAGLGICAQALSRGRAPEGRISAEISEVVARTRSRRGPTTRSVLQAGDLPEGAADGT